MTTNNNPEMGVSLLKGCTIERSHLMVPPGDFNLSAEIKWPGMHGTIRKHFNSKDEKRLNKY